MASGFSGAAPTTDPEAGRAVSDREILAESLRMRQAGDIAGMLHLHTLLLLSMAQYGGRMRINREFGLSILDVQRP